MVTVNHASHASNGKKKRRVEKQKTGGGASVDDSRGMKSTPSPGPPRRTKLRSLSPSQGRTTITKLDKGDSSYDAVSSSAFGRSGSMGTGPRDSERRSPNKVSPSLSTTKE